MSKPTLNRKSFLAMAAALLPLLAAGTSAGTAPDAGYEIDSLRTLEIIIESEMEAKHRVLILKDRPLSDSLIKGYSQFDKGGFADLLADSSLVREIKSKTEFTRYWAKLEEEQGFRKLRDQYVSRDIDKSRVPKIILFDSSVVVYPGWIILRKGKSKGFR